MKEIEISNTEIYECCTLNLDTGEREFYRDSKTKGFMGLYLRRGDFFCALYPSKEGPMLFYENKSYPITPELTINLEKSDDNRVFTIEEYAITIEYKEVPYWDFEWYYEEKDKDFLMRIFEDHKTEEFNTRYTLQ